MAEAAATPIKSKAKPAAAAPAFAAPAFTAPSFDSAFSTLETPAAFREFAEKGLSQAKDGYERMKSIAEETTSLFEGTYATASKGAADYGLKLIEIGRHNTNAAFDYAAELMAVKSLSEVVELTTAHARKQFDAMTAQSRELVALAQKVTTEAAEPLKEGMSRVVKKVA